MDARQLKIIHTGDTTLPDFTWALDPLINQSENVDVDAVDMRLADDLDLLVCFVDRTESFSRKQVDRWVAAAPMLPIVAVLSSHAEGEMRSGEPWPGVIRVYWHKWPYQFAKFLNQWDRQIVPDWNQPKTSSLVDLRLRHEVTMSYDLGLTIAIRSPSKDSFEMYSDDLKTAGCDCSWLQANDCPESCDLVIIDGDSMTRQLELELARLRKRLPDLPIILALGFPRHQEVRGALELGVNAVISKPFDDGELRWVTDSFSNCTPLF